MKLKNLNWTAFLCMFTLILGLAIATPAKASDAEYWSTYSVDAKVTERLKLKFVEQLRINDGKGFYTNVIYAGPVYKLTDRFSAGVLYKNVQKKGSSKEDWHTENGLVLDLYSKANLQDLSYFFPDINWWDIDYAGRNRLEYNAKGTWLYRAKSTVSKDFELAGRNYTPYVANETFINLNDKFRFEQDRAEAGVKTDFFFGTTIKVYYMARLKKQHDGKWTNANILGTTISYKF